ncbi:MAG: electron transfer flavoprotein subunit alpha/FixB family protein [Magnetococcales bacterium]|nr:electron transfer flavoprotein subunit alpha/FixB family protein [Magnetococcales bacterium]
MSVLVVAGDRLGGPSPATSRAVTAGRQLGRVDLLVAGADSDEKCRLGRRIEGVEKVFHVVHSADFPPATENLARVIAHVSSRYRWIVAAHDSFGADLIPRVGGMLATSPVTQVTAIAPPDTLIRPIHAGQALARLLVKRFPALLTIRPIAFPPASDAVACAPVETLAPPPGGPSSRHEAFMTTTGTRPDLSQAAIVVAGGQGLAASGSFATVTALADRLGGAVGATRGAVDAGLASSELQIGQTGRIIAPELYIGLGVSGAIQHLAGIKDAKVIVAINHDPDAPLHAIADLSLVADLHRAAGELDEILHTVQSCLPDLR